MINIKDDWFWRLGPDIELTSYNIACYVISTIGKSCGRDLSELSIESGGWFKDKHYFECKFENKKYKIIVEEV